MKAITAILLIFVYYDTIASIVDYVQGLGLTHIFHSHISGIILWGTILLVMWRWKDGRQKQNS